MEDFKITKIDAVSVEMHTRAEQLLPSRILRGRALYNEEDIRLNEALKLVKASEKEVSDITDLWNTIGISDDGYIIDEDGEEIMYPMPPTKAVVSWLNL